MTFSHRDLDPRAKLAFVSVVSLLAVAIPKLASLAGLSAVLLALVALGRGFGPRELVGSLSPLKLLVPLILVLNAFFYGGGAVLWSARSLGVPLSLTVGGLHASALIAARLLVIAAAASWFAATTEAEEFEVALVRLRVPWSVAFLLSLTLRLVPEMRARFRAVEEAQLSRGLSFSGGPLSRARARIPMLVPFLAAVVRHGYELGEALEAREFGATDRRTSVVTLSHSRADYLLYLASLAVLGAFLTAFVL